MARTQRKLTRTTQLVAWLVFNIIFLPIQIYYDIVNMSFYGIDIDIMVYYTTGGLLFLAIGLILSSAFNLLMSERFPEFHILFRIVFTFAIPLLCVFSISILYDMLGDGDFSQKNFTVVQLKNIWRYTNIILVVGIISSAISQFRVSKSI